MDTRKDESAETKPAAPDNTGTPLSALLSDAEARRLVQGAQRYEKAALGAIYRLFADRIFRYIYYRLGNREQAQDLTGEVFLRLLENIGGYRMSPKGQALALAGWIYRIAHNLVVDEYRRQKRSESEPLPDDWEGDLEGDGGIDIRLTRADLQVALQRLTADQQTVVLLRFDAGHTTGEIAVMLGKSETAIKALQRRAVARLARLLGPEQVRDG